MVSSWLASVSAIDTPSVTAVKSDLVDSRDAFEARPFFARLALGFVVEIVKNKQSGDRR